MTGSYAAAERLVGEPVTVTLSEPGCRLLSAIVLERFEQGLPEPQSSVLADVAREFHAAGEARIRRLVDLVGYDEAERIAAVHLAANPGGELPEAMA